MKWNVDPRQSAMYDENTYHPADLPSSNGFDYNVVTVPSTEQYVPTPNGVLAIGPSVRILPSGTTQSELYMTRSAVNPLILYGSSNSYNTGTGVISEGTYVSTNGGVTWGGMDLLGPTNQGGDPGPTIDKNGVFIMTHLGYTTSGMFANRSVNNGATWANNVTILAGSMDKNLATTDDAVSSSFYGRSYCVWSRFTASLPPIDISYTNDGGATWSAAADINVSPAGHYSQGCDTRVGPNGELYVCWTNPVASSPFTEDFCGFAKSVNGGVSWTINNNNIFDMNGIRGTFPTVNNIRVNSFPRIDVDRTCGPRKGWIYIVVSQINLAPAGSDPDIVIHRSSDGGVTWSAGVRVNQDGLSNGKLQYLPCVRVDESGAVNVFYYDNRNTAAPVMQNYLSRSTDGGATFTDVKVTDHNFTPAPISGLATGYQGDYIGVTSANGKVWCNWMDNSSGIYQSWVASVDYTIPNLCDDFSCPDFPPVNMTEEFSGTNYWTRQTPSAYASGSGSAKFDFWSASAGVTQSLVTLPLTAAVSGTYLTFDRAYSPWSAGTDSLIVETSLNGGATYSALSRLWGNNSGSAPLNTVGILSNFSPTSGGQWAPFIFALPVGTNKIRLRAVSGFGNNLYIDNVCVQSLPAPSSTGGIGVVPQGFYRALPFPQAIPDTVRTFLARVDFPNVKVDSAISYLSTNAVASSPYTRALSGTYYIVVDHRNSIETWSKSGGELYSRGSTLNFNFISPVNQAYNNNQAFIDPAPYYGMYGGDVTRDNSVDLADVAQIENAALNFSTGYVVEDLTGDNFVDLNDLAIADNNSFNFVMRQAPPGAEPAPPPFLQNDSRNIIFENDAQRQKYELSVKLMKEQESKRKENEVNQNIINQRIELRKESLKNAERIKQTDEAIQSGHQHDIYHGKTLGE